MSLKTKSLAPMKSMHLPLTRDSAGQLFRLVLLGFGLLLFIAFLAFIGLLIPFLGIRFTFLLGALFFGASLLFVPAEWVLYLAFVMIFALLGPIKYFGSIDPQWAGYILGVSMFIRALMEASFKAGTNKNVIFRWSAGYFLSGFVVVALFSTLISPPSAYIALISIRGLVMLWGFFFLIAICDFPAKTFPRIAVILALIGIIQGPVAIVQRIFFASSPVVYSQSPWDAVVGTFDGYRQLGGDSGGMGIFMVALLATVLIFWKKKRLSTGWALLLSAAYLVPIFTAEVKVVYVLIPLMFGMIFASEFRRNVPIAILALLLTVGGIYSLDKVYSVLNVSKYQTHQQTLDERLNTIFEFSVGTDVYNEGGEMGRVTALVFWWDRHSLASNPSAFLLGDGMGTSADKTGTGEEYGPDVQTFNFANSTAAILLWDYGAIGFLIYLGMMVALVGKLRNLSRNETIPPDHRCLLEAGSVYAALLIVTLLYNKGLAGQSQPTLLIFVSLMGYAAYWIRETSRTLRDTAGKQRRV